MSRLEEGKPQMQCRRLHVLTACFIALAYAAPARATEAAFAYKTSYRNVAEDPDHVWTGTALAPTPKGTVTIHEYQLRTANDDWLISQIWNEDCSPGTCPTRLIRIGKDGHSSVAIDDMMHQVVPPDDPRFATTPMTDAQKTFARRPFVLSEDGKTLVNGDYKFEIAGAKP
ncbi:hypothetical protein PY365_26960 [Roseiarcaceae bacterium H3SJ34-1]|uniref:hypothetical protein n=1 Tax=Terripilifer ovatus TaxID=3032367 RepID=UPI003AB93C69|nr:hypothetical protein [Roseiarcaceae bacterium H3SJ34-1]